MTKQIKEMEHLLNSKNSYINNFKRDDMVASSTQKEVDYENDARGFDNINEMED